jgi:hypothetical protein
MSIQEKIIIEKRIVTLNRDLFSDEDWFHLSVYVNSPINQWWINENPLAFRGAFLHPQKSALSCFPCRPVNGSLCLLVCLRLY